jgi:hypothetical protein
VASRHLEGLPEEAAAGERYLGRAELTDTERKNALLSLGDLSCATPRLPPRPRRYTRLLALYPDLPIKPEVNAKIAECLARLGRAGEADRLVRKEHGGATAEAHREEGGPARRGVHDREGVRGTRRAPPAPLRRPMKDRESRLAMLHAVCSRWRSWSGRRAPST